MIKVLEKADRVLRVLSERPGIAFGDLASTLGMHKATLSNILSTMVSLGHAERDENGGCRIGPAIKRLAARERRREALPAAAEECARILAEEIGESATVAQLVSGDRYILAKATVERTVTVNAHVELRPTPYETATGRALLAFSSPAQMEEALERHGLPGERWDGIDTRERLRDALDKLRKADCAECSVGDARMIAVPVLDSRGGLLAAVGVNVPSYRLNPRRARQARKALQAAAERMQRALDLAVGQAEEPE